MNILFRSLILAALGAGLASGCGTVKPRAYGLHIEPATSSSVAVDIVAVSDDKYNDIMAYDVNNYWRPNDGFRATADKIPVQISGHRATPQDLSLTDSHWAEWFGSGVTHLVVIADIPGEGFEGLGRLDPRRASIDLKKRFVNDTIVVEIQDKAVKIKTLEKH